MDKEKVLKFQVKTLYVINIDADNNTVIVGDKTNLEIKEIQLRNLNILAPQKEFEKIINIKVRSTGSSLKAKIDLKTDLAIVKVLDKEPNFSWSSMCFL